MEPINNFRQGYNKLAIVAMVLSVFQVLSKLPIIGGKALGGGYLFALVALPLGIIALRKIARISQKGKWIAIVSIVISGIFILVLLGTLFAYWGNSIKRDNNSIETELTGFCPQLNDAQHLEGTIIPLPEHPSVQVKIHCTDPIASGPGWSGYSSQKVILRWAKDQNPPARWTVGVGKMVAGVEGFNQVEVSDKNGTSWFWFPFEVSDNLIPFVATFGSVASTTEHLADNGNPDGHLSYIGLFSYSGNGPAVFHDAAFIGNFVFIEDMRDQGNGKAIVRYHNTQGPDSQKNTDASLLAHKPMQYIKGGGTVVINREGDTLTTSSRHEPAP